MQPMLNIALRAARSAGELIVRSTERLDVISVNEKEAKDYVSEIDRAAEQVIVNSLRKAYPNHGILAEEGGALEGSGDGADYQWIIDHSTAPPTSCAAFLTMQSASRASIVAAWNMRGARPGAPGGIHGEPWAWRRTEWPPPAGQLTQEPGRRPAGHRLSLPRWATGQPRQLPQHVPRPGWTDRGLRRAGAASLDLAYVAAGRFDAFWEFGLSEWDMAAGALLIQEAGGLVSDFAGGHEFLEKGQIVAGNVKCFKAVLTAIQPHLTPSMKR